jgi:hypothetical protein
VAYGAALELQILLDADIAEVFSTAGYAAVRIRPTTDATSHVSWNLPQPPTIASYRHGPQTGNG